METPEFNGPRVHHTGVWYRSTELLRPGFLRSIGVEPYSTRGPPVRELQGLWLFHRDSV